MTAHCHRRSLESVPRVLRLHLCFHWRGHGSSSYPWPTASHCHTSKLRRHGNRASAESQRRHRSIHCSTVPFAWIGNQKGSVFADNSVFLRKRNYFINHFFAVGIFLSHFGQMPDSPHSPQARQI